MKIDVAALKNAQSSLSHGIGELDHGRSTQVHWYHFQRSRRALPNFAQVKDTQPTQLLRSVDSGPIDKCHASSSLRSSPPKKIPSQLINLFDDPNVELEHRDQVCGNG